MQSKHIRMIAILIVFGLMLTACGYRFTGGGTLPEGIRHIAVEVLENRAAETGIETLFTNDLIYEFNTNSQSVVADAVRADAVLSGVIERVTADTLTHQGAYSTSERRVQVSVSFRLVSSEGKVLWQRKSMSQSEEYSVVDSSGAELDKIAVERNRRIALVELSKRMAEAVYTSVTSDF